MATRRSGGVTHKVAVDVGFAVVRAVEVEAAGDQARIVRVGSAVLPAEWWHDPTSHREALAQAIKAALAEGGIRASSVVASLPRRFVTLKYARLPHAEPDQARGMILFEAQQYVPFPMDEVVLDHEVVSDATDEMMTVMIVAARLAQVEGLMSTFDAAGLQVERLTVSSLALAEHARGSMTPVALLEVEPGDMDLAVVADGRLLFSRSAPLSQDPGDTRSIAALGAEVGRSLAAYQNEHRSQPISKLLIDGPANALDAVEEALCALLEIPVSRMQNSLYPADETSCQYATAFGLALGAIRGGSPISLVPETRAQRKVAARRRLQTIVALGAVAVGLTIGGFRLSDSMQHDAKTHAEAVRWNKSMKMAQKSADAARTRHDALLQAYQTVSLGLARQKPAVDVMKTVSDAIPKTGAVHLTQLQFDRAGLVALRGDAKTETAATDLVLALQSSGAFTDVRMPYLGDAQADTVSASGTGPAAKPQPGANMSFIITCRLKPLPGAQAQALANAKKPVARTAGATKNE